jgi:hypothetical protein
VGPCLCDTCLLSTQLLAVKPKFLTVEQRTAVSLAHSQHRVVQVMLVDVASATSTGLNLSNVCPLYVMELLNRCGGVAESSLASTARHSPGALAARMRPWLSTPDAIQDGDFLHRRLLVQSFGSSLRQESPGEAWSAPLRNWTLLQIVLAVG